MRERSSQMLNAVFMQADNQEVFLNEIGDILI